jgi:GTP pyrophosphokinase
VQPAWINFVSTAKAKSKIQAVLRRESREIQKKGEKTLNDWLAKNDMELSTAVVGKLSDFHDIAKHEDFFEALGERTIILGDKDLDVLHGKKKDSGSTGWRKFVPFLNKGKKKKEDDTPQLLVVGKDFDKKKPCIITEETIGMYIFPDCCHPIPGDDILGFIDGKNRIEIHKRSCPVASKLKTSFGPRILDAKWDMHKQLFFDATIEVNGIDRKGMLRDVSEVISNKMNVNIHKVAFTADEGIFKGSIEIRVHDREEVKVIMGRLKKIPDLQEVKQIL